MTACAPGPSFTTHASNFSFFRRSAAFADITTDSIPNCLKHSLKMLRVPSLRSTKAIRAAAFLVWGMGARAVPKPVSMGGVAILASRPILACENRFGKGSYGVFTVQKCHYKRSADGLPSGSCKRCDSGQAHAPISRSFAPLGQTRASAPTREGLTLREGG